MKFNSICAAINYLFAAWFIYLAMSAAPDMTWPHTDLEYIASMFLVIGLSFKLLGHLFLFRLAR